MIVKKCLSISLILCLIFPLTSCEIHEKGDSVAVNTIVGDFIKCAQINPPEAESLINDHGMSGLRAPNHLHNTAEDCSYLTGQKGNDGAITFTLPQTESMGYMYIWNYNVDNKTKNGMKDVRIEYSTDEKTWSSLGNGKYQLAEALQSENDTYKGNAANNQNDGKRTPINFKGVPVKYIKITPLSNYGGSGYGLSQVRFFRYKTRPTNGSVLSVTAASPLNQSENVNSLTNNLGMSDLDSATAAHNNDPSTMWYVETTKASDAMVVLDLDGNYPLQKLVLWNYNDPAHTDYGIQQFKIEYTVKSPNQINNGIIDYSGGDWTTLGTYTLPKADGEKQLPSGLTVDLNNIHAQHIRIIPESNYGGAGFGLSEIRVFSGNGWAVEPSCEWTGLFSSEGSFPYEQSGQNPRNGDGWLAADGIYSIDMNGKDMPGSATESSKTVFLFSDTGVGNFNNFSGTFGKHGDTMNFAEMRNHSMITLTGNKPDPRNMQVYLHAGNGYGNIFDRTAWAQELVRIGGNLYSWAMRFNGWTPTQYDLVKFDITDNGFPDFSKKPSVTDNFPIKDNDDKYSYDFSAAVFDNTASGGGSSTPDGYLYIYGICSWNDGFWLQKAPIVARVKSETFTDRNSWTFWTGKEWDSDLIKAANINANGSDVSSEYSVTYMNEGPFRGKYIMVYTKDTMFNELCFRTADTPYGPFGESTTLYYSPDVYTILEDTGVNDIYTYNGKAHPHLSSSGELLMSYNVNSHSYKTAMEFLHPQFLNLFEIPNS